MARETGERWVKHALSRGADAMGSAARDVWANARERVRTTGETAPAWGERQLGRALDAALSAKGVSVERERFLVHALARKVSHAQAAQAASTTPALAGVAPEVIAALADEETVRETAAAAAVSTASGLVGGPVALGGAALDLAQVLVHLLRLAQKLCYLHGWPHTLSGGGDGDRSLALVLLGTMVGDEDASETLRELLGAMDSADPFLDVEHPATNVSQTLSMRVALALERQLFGSAAGRMVPLLGGACAGALTATTMRAMGRRLCAVLTESPAAREEAWVLVAVEDAFEGTEAEGDVAYEVPRT